MEKGAEREEMQDLRYDECNEGLQEKKVEGKYYLIVAY